MGRYEHAFATGQLEALKALTSKEAQSRGALAWVILAHALTGDLQRALWHQQWIQLKKIKLSSAETATVNFALGVGHMRISEYKKARTCFAANFSLRASGSRERFFFFQGLGFYRFFTSDSARSAKYAELALALATEDKFAFGQLIAEELMAHALIELGQIRRGMRHMKNALDHTRELGHKNLSESFQLLYLLYQARFGLEKQAIAKLERALLKLHPDDSYSRNGVKLELANQWILRGQVDRASRVLEEAFDSIYSCQNRRQIAQLNFRLAFITWLRGRREEALHLLRSTELHLHKEVDHGLWRKMRGLHDRIAENQPAIRCSPRSEFGEDRIGDLYDQVLKKDSGALRRILDQRLYFFLYAAYEIRFDQKALLFDLLPKGAIIINHGNVTVIEQGLARVLRRILEALATSHRSKAEMVKLVWGYDYDPARHDTLVYTSISKIRQLLGAAGNWIEVDEKGYRLQSGVRLQSTALSVIEPAPKDRVRLMATMAKASLNVRQLRILAAFDSDTKDVVGVEEMMKDFGISRASATRDLSDLTREGFLRRMGKARATRYVRTEKPWRKESV
jgi:DNA-binding winged helix-turn-helix (wHTH) protein